MVEVFETPVVLGCCNLAPLGEEEARALSVHLTEMDPWRTLGYQAGGLARYLTRPDPGLARIGVFTEGRRLSGALSVRYPWLFGASLELLAILPGLQGKGLGAELINWLAHQTGAVASNLWTTVSSFNAGGRRFYARHGFETVASLDDLVKPGWDELLLRKRLGAARASELRSDGRRTGGWNGAA